MRLIDLIAICMVTLTVSVVVRACTEVRAYNASVSRAMMNECLDRGERWENCRKWVQMDLELQRIKDGDDDGQ